MASRVSAACEQVSGGLLELNPRRIVIHYLRTTFLIDLLALVPLERVLERGK